MHSLLSVSKNNQAETRQLFSSKISYKELFSLTGFISQEFYTSVHEAKLILNDKLVFDHGNFIKTTINLNLN
jgi:hypothetical protein